jgi:hypothetical protein
MKKTQPPAGFFDLEEIDATFFKYRGLVRKTTG